MTDAQMASVIRRITDGLTPVSRLPRVPVRAARWAVLSTLSLLTVTWLVGPRQDLLTAAPTFALQVIIMGAMAAVGAVAALRLAIPGADRPGDRTWALGVLVLWPCGLLIWALFEGGTKASLLAEPLHLTCARTIGMIALVPAVAMTVMVRRGATLRPWLAAAMAAVAAAGVGAVGVALTCPISGLAHLLIAHAVPTVAVAGILSGATWWALQRKPVSRVAATVVLFALVSIAAPRPVAAGSGADELPAFRVAATTAGYVSSETFLEFLRGAAAGVSQSQPFAGDGPLVIAAAILFGGLLLNLTPCVLPMIPINLAIIGAGRTATSRRRGWILGAAYGSAMAVVYGLLGGLIVATTGTFGVLNSSGWFNAAIAALFVVLGLAMFDVFTLDLSRWSGMPRIEGRSRGSVTLAFFMGGVAALLAGACVAPVVIQVVALSSRLYSGGSRLALGLPLILGVGMGLPWPFAGAGLAALPRPGAWMVRVKQGLGVCILISAAYYGYEAFTLVRPHEVAREIAADGWYQSLDEGLSAARHEGKPVFLDVWATWCKNCVAMDATTFKDPKVREALDEYVKVRFQAEDLEGPDVSALLDRLDSVGLPTYAVLRPAAP
jgi:thioredoxin:protein disulfide reductase